MSQIQYSRHATHSAWSPHIFKRDIQRSDIHFFPHSQNFVHILNGLTLPDTNLTSNGFLQKQSSFDKIGWSLHFLISGAWASDITVKYSILWACIKFSCYPAYLANVKSQPTGILNINCFSEYLSMGVT